MSEVVRRLTEDVANIQKLGDNPRTDNGMDAAELKAWFDKAPEAIKSFLNESMIPDIERKFRSQDEWADTVDEAINSFVKGEGFVPLDRQAIPKSVTFTVPSRRTMIFWGLISRWIRLRLWA